VRAAIDVIYLLFNEGHSAHAGENLTRADLCREALRLGRLVADAPATATPEAHALVALMAFQAARIPARTDAAGRLVRLDDQDRTMWDADLIAMGFGYFLRSMAGRRETSLHLQAAIAATHAATPHARATDWRTILQLFDALVAIDPSPVARLNRAVAVARVHGPAAALAVVEPLARERAFARYHLLPAMRAEWLAALGRAAEARRAYSAALARPCSGPERRFLERQLDALPRRSA
jgi:RNA polymerase sigma-70 factor (ECF subfamily)